ncbi:MAG: hypothetical protein ACLPLR_03870 [Terriglobales bacterium]
MADDVVSVPVTDEMMRQAALDADAAHKTCGRCWYRVLEKDFDREPEHFPIEKLCEHCQQVVLEQLKVNAINEIRNRPLVAERQRQLAERKERLIAKYGAEGAATFERKRVARNKARRDKAARLRRKANRERKRPQWGDVDY